MEKYYGISRSTTTITDQTVSSRGSGPWTRSSPIQRPRFRTPLPSAFLADAFEACAVGGESPANHIDLDPALLRYTRSCLSDQSEPTTRPRLLPHMLLRMRPPRGGASSSPLSPIENVMAAMYKTPVKVEVEEDVLVMDGVLVGENDVPARGRIENDLGSLGGKQELRGARPTKLKSELMGGRQSSKQATEGSCAHGIKSRYLPPHIAAAIGTTAAPKAHHISMAKAEEFTVIAAALDYTKVPKAKAIMAEMEGSRAEQSKNRYIPPHIVAAALGSAAAPTANLGMAKPEQISAVTAAAKVSMPKAKEEIPPFATALGSAAAPNAKISATKAGEISSVITPPSEPSLVWPPTPEEEVIIERVLYGPPQRTRLPVFREICPD